MALTEVSECPHWKARERQDLEAELDQLPPGAQDLKARALRAYDLYELAPVVLWAARRSWAQGVPFWPVFHNHRIDAVVQSERNRRAGL